MTRLAASVLLSLLLAPSALPQPPRTARDAYVDGWFKETAESDLEGALALYRECAELAATSDRELAAKATLRMARIALARDDADAAAILLDRLKQEYAGTAAASDAAAAAAELEGVTTGKDASAVTEGRQFLDEMLADEGTVTSQKADTVFRVLGVDEPMRRHAVRGGKLSSIVGRVSATTLSLDDWVKLATLSHVDVRCVAVRKVGDVAPSEIPSSLFENVPPRTPEQIPPRTCEYVKQLILLFARVPSADGRERLKGVLDRLDPSDLQYVLNSQEVVNLLADGREGVADAIEVWLEAMIGRDVLAAWLRGNSISHDLIWNPTPAAERWRRHIPSFPTDSRVAMTWNRLKEKPHVELVDPLAAALRSDPEPWVRLAVIANDLRSPEPAARRAAAAGLTSMTPPIPVGWVGWSLLGDPSVSHQELLEVAKGPLLELIYHALLSSDVRPQLTVVRFGLARGDPEMSYALFRPRFDRSFALADVSGYTRGATNPAWNTQRIRAALAADPDPTLLSQLADQVIAIGDDTLQMGAIARLDELFADRLGAGVADRFVEHGSPAVLHAIARRKEAIAGLTRDNQRRLLSHPSRDVRQQAQQNCEDVELLLELVPEGDEVQHFMLWQRSKLLGSDRLARAVLEHADPSGAAAVQCFLQLLPLDDAILRLGLTRGGTETALGSAAMSTIEAIAGVKPGRSIESGVLEGLAPVPEFRSALVLALNFPGDWTQKHQAVAKALHEHASAWAESLRDFRKRRIAAQLASGQRQPVQTGRQLAALGERDLILQLVNSEMQQSQSAGLFGLAALGEKDALLQFGKERATDTNWLMPAVISGLRGELVALAREGRVSFDDLYRAAEAHDDLDFRCDLLFGDEAWRVGSVSIQSDSFRVAIDRLVERKDIDRLIRAAGDYDSEYAVQCLFALGAVDRILDGLPRWPYTAARAAFAELQRRTGIPDASASNSSWQYESQRVELVAKWRAAL